MNHNNKPEQNKQQAASMRNWVGIAVIILAVVLPILILSQGRQNVEESSIAEIVSAVEAGDVESLTVQGDFLIATKTDGTTLSARKESNISAVEALQLLGASPESLKTVPIMVRNPATGPGSILGILLTCAAIYVYNLDRSRVTISLDGRNRELWAYSRNSPTY